MLRPLNFVLCLLTLGMAMAQYGRPEWWLWGCIALWGALVWRHWPQASGFWRPAVWQHDANARAGLGLMLAPAVLLVALFTAYRKR